MITLVFYACVMLLVAVARTFGTTYEMVNVVFFCVIWPLFTIAETLAVIVLARRLRRQRKRLDVLEGRPPATAHMSRRVALWGWRSIAGVTIGVPVAAALVIFARFGGADGEVLDSCTNRVRRDALRGTYRGPGRYDEITGAYRALKTCAVVPRAKGRSASRK
jgi:hypothetical protein